MKPRGLSRQIVYAMVGSAVAVTMLFFIGSYAFFFAALVWWPDLFNSKDVFPSTQEVVWFIVTIVFALIMAFFFAAKLSARILTPINSVAIAVRRVAQGDLGARAEAGDHPLSEAAALTTDFNALVSKLQRITEEQTFWNAAIAHELRTPLTIIKGRLQGLADGIFPATDEQFHRMLGHVEGLARVIDDLQVVSLAESGRLTLQWREVDLASEIASVTEAFTGNASAKGMDIHLDLQGGPIYCDPVRIRQALIALLENARRHASGSPVHIASRTDEASCRVTVRDEGPGIEHELLPHVFQAFRSGTSQKAGSSGLGLAVVAAIARAHRGEVSCRSEGGQGTEFHLSWPNAPAG